MSGEQLDIVPNERPTCPKHPKQLLAIGCETCRAAAYAWQCRACNAWNVFTQTFCQSCYVRRWSKNYSRIGDPRSPKGGARRG